MCMLTAEPLEAACSKIQICIARRSSVSDLHTLQPLVSDSTDYGHTRMVKTELRTVPCRTRRAGLPVPFEEQLSILRTSAQPLPLKVGCLDEQSRQIRIKTRCSSSAPRSRLLGAGRKPSSAPRSPPTAAGQRCHAAAASTAAAAPVRPPIWWRARWCTPAPQCRATAPC